MGMLSVIKNIPKLIKHGGNRLIFAVKKAKPEIMVAAGAVITTGGFVWAIVNARKMSEVMEESAQKTNDIQNRITAAEEANTNGDESAKSLLKELNRELKRAQLDGIKKMFLLMGLPVLTFAGGLVVMVGGHVVLVRRFGEVSALFAALEDKYNRYRQLNIAEHGEECDRRYIRGIVGETETTMTVTDEETGETKTVQCKVPIVDQNKAASLYSFVFSEETSAKCPRDPVNTISFLRCQQKYWNIWMHAKGKPVTLSMVLEDLGLTIDPDDPANDYILIAGWRPNGDGDNKIDFGIMRAINKPVLNMEENVVMLNFNCDGNLYHSTRYRQKDGKKVC